MKKNIISRLWIVFGGALLIIMGIGFFNRDFLSLTLGDTKYFIRHPSSVLGVGVVISCFSGIFAYIIEAFFPFKKNKIVVSLILSLAFFLCAVFFVFFNSSTFTSRDRTNVGSSVIGHDFIYELTTYVFWGDERDLTIAGDHLAGIFKNSTSNTGTAYEYEDVIFSRRYYKDNNGVQDSWVEKKIFRCETAKISWKMPLISYRQLKINDYDFTLLDIQKICGEIKESDVSKGENTVFSYDDNTGLYRETY